MSATATGLAGIRRIKLCSTSQSTYNPNATENTIAPVIPATSNMRFMTVSLLTSGPGFLPANTPEQQSSHTTEY
jgi:hypothetical protein